jgi:hypothetical protein
MALPQALSSIWVTGRGELVWGALRKIDASFVMCHPVCFYRKVYPTSCRSAREG